MNSNLYDIEDVNLKPADFPAVLEAYASIVRLDQRAKDSSLSSGWQERLLFDEALACQDALGNKVHMMDLVLLDGEGRRERTHPDLLDTLFMLRTFRRAAAGDAFELLRSDRPGIANGAIEIPSDPLRKPIKLKGYKAGPPIGEQPQTDVAALEQWRRMVRSTEGLTPLLAAAVAWDLWSILVPEPGSGWRASLLAALVLRKRRVTENYLLPIDTGRKLTPYRYDMDQSLEERLTGIISWMHAAAVRSDKQFGTLGQAQALMRRRIVGRRRRSRLAALMDLFLSRPLVSIPLAARHLQCSTQAVEKMLPLLGSAPVLMTERKRFRAWRVA